MTRVYDQDREANRKTWIRFAAAALTAMPSSPEAAAVSADQMLYELQKRDDADRFLFSAPAKTT